jgi:hypothetical protein
MKHQKLFFILAFAAISLNSKAQNDTPSVIIYPNPNNGIFNVQVDHHKTEQANLVLYNLLGQTLDSQQVMLKNGRSIFWKNTTSISEGIYFVKLSNNSWGRITKMMRTDFLTANDSIDVLHYNLNLSIRNLANKRIAGNAELRIAANVPGLNRFTLDLLKLQVDSVWMNNSPIAFTRTDSTLSVSLNQPLAAPDTFSVTIFYQGQPQTDPQWGGFYFSGNYAYNMGVGFQSKPHNLGRCWFPCVDNFVDRATYEFHITTDPTFKAVCNGLMQPETNNPDGSTTWNWQLNQTIPTYLASVAVGKYEFVKYEFTGINRTYPVWLAVIAADSNKLKTSFAKLNTALQCFESKYGLYSFDRVGYVAVPFNAGAMEHATNIAYPIYAINGNSDYETLLAHELAHMWWGNLATCRTAEDMWLNEGWASFNEALFLECAYGKNFYLTDIQSKSIEVLKNAAKNDGAWYPVSGVPHNATYGTHVYKKGALMVHTLRTLMGDEAFFMACKSYLNKYRFIDVGSEELKTEFQRYTAIDLTNFFDKWIYASGHSSIVLSSIATKQIGSNTTTYSFDFAELNKRNALYTKSLPFLFKAYLSTGDSIVKILNTASGFCTFDTTLGINATLVSYAINDDYALHLASHTQFQSISNTGTVAFSDALITLTVQQTGNGTNPTYITHHWVGPIPGNIRGKGIRPSTDRYWTIQGKWSQGFSTSAFFNYDGRASAFLDETLITETEDSLVLLYRASPEASWEVYPEVTFQPGSSKTDKIGRFIAASLKRGEYTFGIKDINVVSIAETSSKQYITMKIIPNPSNDEASVKVELGGRMYVKKILVTDLQGKPLAEHAIESTIETFTLPTKGMKTGQYIVTAILIDSHVSSKFIKR